MGRSRTGRRSDCCRRSDPGECPGRCCRGRRLAVPVDADFDLVVVGAGLAGSAAACRATELGARVALLDSCEDPAAGGNTTLSGGGMHVARLRLDSEPAALREKLFARALLPRPALINALAANTGKAFAWLQEQGVQFEPEPPGDIEFVLAPERDLGDVHAWRDRGPHLMLRRLQARVEMKGGAVVPRCSARELAFDPHGRVAGVVSDDGRRVTAPNVLLADGGFQANHDLRRRFIGPAADRMFLRGSPLSTGTGLLLAESAGAKLVNTEWFYGHVMHRDVLKNDRLWPWPALDEILLLGAVLVGSDGKRFVDEGRGGDFAANMLGRSVDPRGATLVLDEQIWAAAAGELVWGHRAANPELVERGASLLRGADARELARVAGIDPLGLHETIETYSSAAAAEQAHNLPIRRSGTAPPLRGELLGLPAVGAISHSMGGPLIDARTRVLDQEEQPIEGLYAAGACAAGPTIGYFGGLASALTFGVIAAETVDGRARSVPAAEEVA